MAQSFLRCKDSENFGHFVSGAQEKWKKSVIFLLAIDYLQKNQYFCTHKTNYSI